MGNGRVKLLISLFLSFILVLILTTIVILLYRKQLLSDSAFTSLQTFTKIDSHTPTLPTIDNIFSNNHEWVSTLSANRITTIIATGDVIPARVVNQKTTNYNNFKWPYEKTADLLISADITFINLETPLLFDCKVITEGFTFCGSDKHLEGLLYSGVDVASLANNHAGNYGVKGVEETFNLLNFNGIATTGTISKNLVVKEKNGIKFAFLGFNDIEKLNNGIMNADFEEIKSQIQDAKQNADVVIVAYHWGVEYRDFPDDRQIELGHFTIDSGADLVIGNHPHWIQPIEFYKGKIITYAHGNFIFDQMWSEETKKGVLGKYTFYGLQLIDVEYFPTYIEDYGQPRFTDNEERKSILNQMKNRSEKLMNM